MVVKQTVVKTTCCNTCSFQCGVKVHVRDGEVLKIEGDRDNPLGKGRMCVKARASIDFHNHPQRLNFPLKRTGARGANEWVRVSWEQAMDEIAETIAKIELEYGPEAVAFLGGGAGHEPGDWAAWRWSNLFGTPNIHNQGKNCAEAEFLTECATYGYHTFALPEANVTKCVVVWGSNPSASSPILSWHKILEARASGCKVIVVDPRGTPMASKADLWLQLRPGTDGALGLGMLNVIIGEGLYDKKMFLLQGQKDTKSLLKSIVADSMKSKSWLMPIHHQR